MSTMVNRVSLEFFGETPYGTIAGSAGLVAILALFALLLARELLRASGGRSEPPARIRMLDVGAVPLLASAGLVVLLRTLQFL